MHYSITFSSVTRPECQRPECWSQAASRPPARSRIPKTSSFWYFASQLWVSFPTFWVSNFRANSWTLNPDCGKLSAHWTTLPLSSLLHWYSYCIALHCIALLLTLFSAAIVTVRSAMEHCMVCTAVESLSLSIVNHLYEVHVCISLSVIFIVYTVYILYIL